MLNPHSDERRNYMPVNGFRYDYFFSHTSEDRARVVLPLVKELDKLSIRYFIDIQQIPIGRSLFQSLSDGLRQSAFFIAIISENYLRKEWTVAELNAAFIRQVRSRKDFILPILVGTEQQQVYIIEQIQLIGDLRHLIWQDNAAEIAFLLADRLNRN